MTTELLHNFRVKETDFETIFPLWKLLWPNSNDIQHMSSMKYLGGYDTEIYKKYAPSFFKLTIDNQIVGVVSGHKSDQESFRLRGIYIKKQYRKQKLSLLLFSAISDQAKKENCSNVWSFPRDKSLQSYISAGFVQTSKFLNTNDIKYGPNCFVILKF